MASKYTNEKLFEIALKYDSRSRFKEGNRYAYKIACDLGIMDKICLHMIPKYNIWTYDKIAKSALKYKYRKEFEKSNPKAYWSASYRGILDDVCSHMIELNHDWTTEELFNVALKYKYRSDFQKNDGNAYKVAQTRNMIDDICSHMLIKGDRLTRGVYTYKLFFNGKKYAYSGLTYYFENRHDRHLNCVKNKKSGTGIDGFCIENNISLPNMEIAFDYMSIEEARIKEDDNRLNLEKQGYIILNIKKCGGVGGTYKKYTNEEIAKKALKYKYRSDFQNKDNSTYQAARTRGILNGVCSHMKDKQHKWTNDEIYEEMLKYKYRSDFKIGNRYLYKIARERGIYEKGCSHMVPKKIYN